MTSVEVASSTIESSAVVKADDTKKDTHTLLGGHHEVNMLIRKFISGRVRHAFLANVVRNHGRVDRKERADARYPQEPFACLDTDVLRDAQSLGRQGGTAPESHNER